MGSVGNILECCPMGMDIGQLDNIISHDEIVQEWLFTSLLSNFIPFGIFCCMIVH